MGRDPFDQPFVTGRWPAGEGEAPQVDWRLKPADRWGAARARWGVNRLHYLVEPGLYALGRPEASCPVLVTANYKLTFDYLRSALEGLDAWLLVLDTDGINVWCAAGKGSFGSEELVRRIREASLDKVVNHREVILPQLGAPGVAAYAIKKLCGFRAVYGPIRARDLLAFLARGKKASPAMRLKTFPWTERLVLIPVELVQSAAYVLPAALIMALLAGLGGTGGWWAETLSAGLPAALALLAGLAAGAVATPLLLPWLPGRAFSLKGLGAGAGLATVFLALSGLAGAWAGKHWLEPVSWVLLIISLGSFLGMNFTGASTYTSLSGVKKEMRRAVPLQILGALTGLAAWVAARFVL